MATIFMLTFEYMEGPETVQPYSSIELAKDALQVSLNERSAMFWDDDPTGYPPGRITRDHFEDMTDIPQGAFHPLGLPKPALYSTTDIEWEFHPATQYDKAYWHGSHFWGDCWISEREIDAEFHFNT